MWTPLFLLLRSSLIGALSMTADQDMQGTRAVKYLALCDSYTIGESVAEQERWPNQLDEVLSRRTGRDINTTILATTGWRTDNLNNAINMARIEEVYDLVSLLIGVNNQYQGKSVEEYASEFEGLLKTSVRLAKGKPENVFVVSIPDYGFTPFGQKNQANISAAIDQFNAINKRISDQYKVKYVNVTDISREGLRQ